MSWHYTRPAAGYLTPVERQQVEVVFDALHPDDVNRRIPGAAHAKAAEFLDLLLASDENTFDQIPKWRDQYRSGLAHLDRASEAVFGRPLASLGRNQATELLKQLEAAKLSSLPADFAQPQFLSLLWRHCLQGCYADPRWGGNHNYIMWRWYGHLRDPEQVDLATL